MKHDTKTPTPETTFALLDAEIKHLDRKETRRGWTLWAIYAALTATLWLLLDQIEAARYSVDVTAKWFLAISLAVDGVYLLAAFMRREKARTTDRIRYHFAEDLYANRVRPFVLFIRYATLIVIAAYLGRETMSLRLIAVGVFYTALALSTAYGFIQSFSRRPVAILGTGNLYTGYTELLTLSVMLGIAGLSSWGLFRALFGGGVSVPDVRTGGLLVVTGWIVTYFATDKPDARVRERLLQIRRDIAFGRLAIQEALQEIEKTLLGMYVIDLLRGQVKCMRALADQFGADLPSGGENVPGGMNGEPRFERAMRNYAEYQRQLRRIARLFALTEQHAGLSSANQKLVGIGRQMEAQLALRQAKFEGSSL